MKVEIEATIANESYPVKMSIDPNEFIVTTILQSFVFGLIGDTTICVTKGDYQKLLNNKSFNN